MADDQTEAAKSTKTLKEAMLTLNPKIVLAFFLTVIAATMVCILLLVIVYSPAGKLDAGTIALIASMVMLFIKMAADACGYQTQSSAGSDKKDDTNAKAMQTLATSVPVSAIPTLTPPPSPAPFAPWWPKLTDAEKSAITAAAPADPRVSAFVSAAVTGPATTDDLAYLASKNLIAQNRIAAIAGT